jgi:hypothetical protein
VKSIHNARFSSHPLWKSEFLIFIAYLSEDIIRMAGFHRAVFPLTETARKQSLIPTERLGNQAAHQIIEENYGQNSYYARQGYTFPIFEIVYSMN